MAEFGLVEFYFRPCRQIFIEMDAHLVLRRFALDETVSQLAVVDAVNKHGASVSNFSSRLVLLHKSLLSDSLLLLM